MRWAIVVNFGVPARARSARRSRANSTIGPPFGSRSRCGLGIDEVPRVTRGEAGSASHRQGPSLAPEGSSAVPRGRYAFGGVATPTLRRAVQGRASPRGTDGGRWERGSGTRSTYVVRARSDSDPDNGRAAVYSAVRNGLSGGHDQRGGSGAGGAPGPWTRATVGAVHDASSSIRGVTRAEGRSRPVVSQSLCGVRRPA